MKIRMLAKKRASFVVGLLCCCSLVFSGCSVFLPNEEEEMAPPLVQPKQVTYKTAQVKKGSIKDSLKASGNFTSTTVETLTFNKNTGILSKKSVTLGDRVKKGQVLAELDSEQAIRNIEQQKIEVEKARINYELSTLPASSKERQLLGVEYESQKLKLKQYQEDLDKTRIYAPFDGVVTFVTNAAVGDNIAQRSAVVTVAYPAKMILTCTTNDYLKFPVGTVVLVTNGKDTFQGTIVANSSMANSIITDKSFKGIAVRCTNPPATVTIGSYGQVELVVQEKNDIIVIQKSLISKYGGKQYVDVLVDGVKRERLVEVGIESSSEAEITSGLQVGDLLVLGY